MKKILPVIFCFMALLSFAACSRVEPATGSLSETAQETVSSPSHKTARPLRDGLSEERITPGFVATLDAADTYDRIMLTVLPDSTSSEGLFYYFEKIDGVWVDQLVEVTYIGSEGVGDADFYHEVTPAGIYPFRMLFGIKPDPGCIMPYTQLTGSEYWCAGTYFNQFIDERYFDHSACAKERDEHLAEIDSYQYVAAFDYNPECIVDEGCAFFLHCYCDHPWTEGCVSIPEEAMRYLMTRIDENTCIIIDTVDNLTNY